MTVDIFTLLSDDHQRAMALFTKLEGSDGASGEERATLFQELRKELTLHKEAEERTFYAALAILPETTALIEDAIEDHLDIVELLDDLAELDEDEPEFMSQLSRLREEVQDHIALEEDEIFSRARQVLSPDQTRNLATDMLAEKDRLTAA